MPFGDVPYGDGPLGIISPPALLPVKRGGNKYRYLAYSLLNMTYLMDLPLQNVSFTRLLNDAGGMSATMFLDKASGGDPIACSQPGSIALFVERSDIKTGANAHLVWGGIIWTRRKQLNNQFARDIGASELFSYFDRRFIGGAYPNSLYYVNFDQNLIAADIINQMQSVSGGNIGVQVPTPALSGTVMTQTYYNYQYTNAGQAIRDLAARSGGFDFTIDVDYIPGTTTPNPVFNVYFPQRGRKSTLSYNPLRWDHPGNVSDYEWPEDATKTANVVTAVGAGTGTAILASTATQAGIGTTSKIPVLEVVNSYKTETVRANVTSRAQSDLAVQQNVVTIPNIIVRADQDPIIGTYDVGDEFFLNIKDRNFPNGVSGWYRIVGITVQPADNGMDEHVQLTLSTVL